jgi:hypothetical protein
VADGDPADGADIAGRRQLANGTLVATVMSNLGLKRCLEAQGLAEARARLCGRGNAQVEAIIWAVNSQATSTSSLCHG